MQKNAKEIKKKFLKKLKHKMEKKKICNKEDNTKRYASSAVTYMTELLNIDEENKRKMIRKIK